MFSFQKQYFFPLVVLFIVEVSIAIFVHDKFIRPFAGDFLVVIMLYCGVKSFIVNNVFVVALSVLLFAYFIELLQYLKLIRYIGLQHSRLANIILGKYFTWHDIISYTLGIIAVLCTEKWFLKKRAFQNKKIRPEGRIYVHAKKN